jgi:hypothetical protein
MDDAVDYWSVVIRHTKNSGETSHKILDERVRILYRETLDISGQ